MSEVLRPDVIDQRLAAVGSDLRGIRALEELALAGKRYALTHEQRVVATVAKLKIARHGGDVLIKMAAKGERKTRQTAALKSSNSAVLDLTTLGIGRMRSSRWQRLARLDSDKFSEVLQSVMEMDPDGPDLGAVASTAHVSSEKDEWETPDDLFAALDAEFHFDLDVCASADNAKCAEFFTVEDDGLSRPWTGTCWMNPPYSDTSLWMSKAMNEGATGSVVVCLVPSRTDVGWFWDFARHGEVRFLRGRLSFTSDTGLTGPAPFPSCVVVFGHPTGVVWYDF